MKRLLKFLAGGQEKARAKGDAPGPATDAATAAAATDGDPRRVPFAPQGARPPLFFVHIPKTSGSSVNRLLQQIYGPENTVTHAEYALPALLSGQEPTRQVDCVSGHVLLSVWLAYRDTSAYQLATVLRDPWARLVSHVNWLARMSDGADLPGGPSHASVAAAAAQIGQTDFSDRDSICRLVDVCNAQPMLNAFDNLQTRMLLDRGGLNTLFRPMVPGDAARAVANLGRFAVIGLCEDQPRLALDLASFAGVAVPPGKVHENPAQARVLHVSNDLARQVMAPWVAMDQQVYDAAVRRLNG